MPDILVAEIIDGELLTSPRPAFPHAQAASAILQDLGPFARRSGGPHDLGEWWILFAPELHLGADILVLDVAGWRRERMPVLGNVPYSEQAPDWLCEVISPSTGRTDRVRKMRIYAREGVNHVWLADPLQRTLEIYRLEGQHWLLVNTHEESDLVRAEPFATLELDLSRWWLEV